ncbi:MULTISPECIES: galactonate dehydratase [unclassified Streptomyces]|uniref:galactonate dehydratase n=1 Tax=unclassified Streptomyces TaxID=2593676 RepID=UPI00336AD100
MKITGYELFLVEPRWLFLRIDTDEGIAGWGEPIVEGKARTVAQCVEEMFDYLIGQDPTRIEEHWQVLAKSGFYRGGPVLNSALAGIDQALWDIAGKALGVPVHQLLGGHVRDRVRIYGWVGGETLQELAESAAEQVAKGLTAVKMNPCGQLEPLDTPATINAMVARVAAVREAVGPECDVALDFHGRFSGAMSRRVLPLLEPLLPMFVEEPVLPEFTQDLGAVVRSTSIPIATGERLYSRWDFRSVLSDGIAVAQPDISHAGGISETRRIAAMAEAHDVLVAPHCPLGPIALAASLQLDLAVPNFLIQEQALGIGYGDSSGLLDYLLDPSPFTAEAGHIPRLTAPGLGITIDEDAVRTAAERGHSWRNPVWRNADGSLAAW